MSKKLYIDLMRIFAEQAPTLRDTGGDVNHLKNILEVLDSQLQAGKTESKVGALKWINLMFTIGTTHILHEHLMQGKKACREDQQISIVKGSFISKKCFQHPISC